MRKVLAVLLIVFSGCVYPTYNVVHWRAHHFDKLVDTFTVDQVRYEVRQCTRDNCPQLDTFPKYAVFFH